MARDRNRPDGGDDRHVYLVDLADPTLGLTRLDEHGAAAMPVLLGNDVYWKRAPQQFSSLNWGNLERMRLPAGLPEPVPFFAHEPHALNRPSAGTRYLTAELMNPTVMAAFDTERWETIVVEQMDELGPEVFAGPRVGGDILVWMYSRDFTGAGREIRLARLGDGR